MSLPSFYNPDQVGTLFTPDTSAIMNAGINTNVPPAKSDDHRVMLLLTDIQVDFVHEDGALYMPGAIDDTRRSIEWIYNNLDGFTTIAASIDSHTPNQIFYPGWWIDMDGNHPDPLTQISAEDVSDGRWQPTTEEEWSHYYVQALEEESKKVLTIWPYHCMIGTPGYQLVPSLYEAATYHAAARATQPVYVHKGRIPKTEHYSIMEPEINVPDEPLGKMNMDLIHLMENHDTIYITGQAKSHCVLETLRSLVNYFEANNADMLERLHYLTDGSSSVQHPDVDFDAYAEEELDALYDRGLQTSDTTQSPKQQSYVLLKQCLAKQLIELIPAIPLNIVVTTSEWQGYYM